MPYNNTELEDDFEWDDGNILMPTEEDLDFEELDDDFPDENYQNNTPLTERELIELERSL